ncbi:MAG: threonine synthase [Clostridia bacterium]|nr:threonine synthase [Clostridia bacterium]
MYISTRGGEKLTASQAILKGLSSNGGLFLPEKIFNINFDKAFFNKDYKQIAFDVFKVFLDDFSDEEINYVVNSAYSVENFNEKFVGFKNFDGVTFLELYHGPTLAFKDMALTALPFLIEVSKKKNNENRKSLILVATSGDTGGAALSSFMKNAEFETVVLYPNGGVSEIQEKQMLYYTNDRTHAYAINGNFDDCQNFVKSVFNKYDKDGVLLSSANSINIGRLIPQVIYYVFSYAYMVKSGIISEGEEFNVCVPTGNFGDIFAGYLAKKIGVPVKQFICASNVNNVLTDFFNTGVYNRNRTFYKSNSPAMDILISSNLERLVYYACNENSERVNELMNLLKTEGEYRLNDDERAFLSNFSASFATESETLASINKAFNDLGYLIDPHTAVAYHVYNNLESNGARTLIVSTASPFKFPYTVASALNLSLLGGEVEIIKEISAKCEVAVPYGIKKLLSSIKPTILKTRDQIEDIVFYRNMSCTVKVPCSTANLGSGFDCAGIALSLYNTFRFEQAEKDEVVNFYGEDLSHNLVLKSYKRLFEETGKEYIPVKITLLDSEVPSSRGLGSSATCIVAGVLGADFMLKRVNSVKTLLTDMSHIEGHPDNVAPCYIGDMVCAFYNGETVNYYKYAVSDNLDFYAFVPNFELKTKASRSALPKNISYQDAVHNLAAVVNLGKAMELGDLDTIKYAFDDKIHQPYRFPLINGASELKKILESQGFAVALSGSGPTILAVGKNVTPNVPKLVGGVNWKMVKLEVEKFGATVL